MLIDDVVNFCNKEYQTHNCSECGNQMLCIHDCKNCLDDLHYHRNKLRTDYSCEHLLDYYMCRYSYKYCSEIIHALENIDLSKYPYFNIVSLGCGGSPDLMAFDYMKLPQQITYKGFDLNQSWEKIHNYITLSSPLMNIEYCRNCNVLTHFDKSPLENCNVIIIEYLISFFYNQIGVQGLKTWFDQLARQIVAHKPADSPMLIIINDADSCNVGRDSFPLMRTSIEQQGMVVANEYRCRFKEENYYAYSIKYPTQRNYFYIPEDFGEKYKVAIKCESAQYILEIE